MMGRVEVESPAKYWSLLEFSSRTHNKMSRDGGECRYGKEMVILSDREV